ncbi:hypothetical protein [Nocardia nova]|uniref:hypothetical protein n=1 Tax=Nocardia nova TaxID=37330 RepID=UPI0033CD61E9
MIKNGTRLESQVCETQVIVVKSSEALDELRCGGHDMVPIGTAGARTAPDPEFAAGALLGKRYVHDSGAELLVTRSGAGTLSVGETALAHKQAAQLPASD